MLVVRGGTPVVGYRGLVKDEWVSMEFPSTISFISLYNVFAQKYKYSFEARTNKNTFEYCLEFFAPLDHDIRGQFMRPNP